MKKMLKPVVASLLTIGVVGGAFQGLIEIALAAELEKTDNVSASYQISSLNAGAGKVENNKNASNGIVKANYTIVDNDLAFYKDKKPTDLDISKEEAAEIGVQKLGEIFGIDLDGKEIEMAYDSAHDGYRAKWGGEWWIDGKYKSTQNYGFDLDSVTGEVMSVYYSRTLKDKAEVGFDADLEKNHQDFAELAKTTAEKFNVVNGPVKAVEYIGQGYSSNDPTINFNIIGENGDCAHLLFSRYDKTLLAISFRETIKEIQIQDRETEAFLKRVSKYFEENPDATNYEERDEDGNVVGEGVIMSAQ